MTRIRLITAGESHGPLELCILEGVPAGLALTAEDVNRDLAHRQRGYGRGARMSIEKDSCRFAAGVRLGLTIGTPIALLVENHDHENWRTSMQAAPRPVEAHIRQPGESEKAVPRPGHADYVGMAKYGFREIRPVLERASARETVGRVAGGAICRRLLEELGVTIRSRVVSLGTVSGEGEGVEFARPESIDWQEVERSPVACSDQKASIAMCSAIDAAREQGESLGGVFEVWAWGLCPGLGSYAYMTERLDGRLLGAVGSIPAIKGVEIGAAFADASLPGSQVHDAFAVISKGTMRALTRPTNRAGGIEGGVTNGMPVVIRAAMKPIPTLTTPLASVDLLTMTEAPAHVERSDVTAVPAAGVVGEAMVAYVLADAYAEKFGGDSMPELLRATEEYRKDLEERGLWLLS